MTHDYLGRVFVAFRNKASSLGTDDEPVGRPGNSYRDVSVMCGSPPAKCARIERFASKLRRQRHRPAGMALLATAEKISPETESNVSSDSV